MGELISIVVDRTQAHLIRWTFDGEAYISPNLGNRKLMIYSGSDGKIHLEMTSVGYHEDIETQTEVTETDNPPLRTLYDLIREREVNDLFGTIHEALNALGEEEAP
jgi:hypothetical protein